MFLIFILFSVRDFLFLSVHVCVISCEAAHERDTAGNRTLLNHEASRPQGGAPVKSFTCEAATGRQLRKQLRISAEL